MSLVLAIDDQRRPSAGVIYDPITLAKLFAQYGVGALPNIDFTLANGTGPGNANEWYLAQRTLAPTTFDLLNLYGGLNDFEGNALNFKYIRRVLVALAAPDGTLSLQVGPQNQTNAWVGPWGGTGATVYRTVWDVDDMRNPFAGWTVTSGSSNILPIYNPGSSAVTYGIWIIGEV